jgi:hypothetical protein
MKAELEDKLFKSYPNIFPKGRDVDMRENLMCFGFSHGDGWYNILDELFTDITILLGDTYKIDMVQVKEKFGTLRLYYDVNVGTNSLSDDIHGLVMEAVKKSSEVCEVCGKPGQCKNVSGWISTLCDEHRENKEEE